MQTLQDINAEELARLFHHYHEALTRECGSDSNDASDSWDLAPQSERKLMVTAARLALMELAAAEESPHPTRKYYAKPGEAD